MAGEVITGVIVIVLGAATLGLLGWLLRGWGRRTLRRFRAAARVFREPEASDAPSAAHPDWTDPEDLRGYLQRIKSVMEEEGFGSQPPAPTASRFEVQPSQESPSLAEERDALIKRGHELLGTMAASATVVGGLAVAGQRAMGHPAAIAFVRDGQELVSRVLPSRARPELIDSYRTTDEAKFAIQETVNALANIGHDVNS